MIPMTGTLLFVQGNLWQNRRLDLFRFLFFFRLIDQLPPRIDQVGRHEDDEVALDVLFCVRAKEPSDDWDVS